MSTIPLHRTQLNVWSIDITRTQYNWDIDIHQDIEQIYPHVWNLTKSECQAILAYREDDSRLISASSDIELLRHNVASSDKQHWDEFNPCGDSFFCEIPDMRSRRSPEVMQSILRNSPIIVVKLNDRFVLAPCQDYPNIELEFCRAYVTLGYLPPLSMINFSKPHSELEPELIAACLRTVEVYERLCAQTRSTLEAITSKQYATLS